MPASHVPGRAGRCRCRPFSELSWPCVSKSAIDSPCECEHNNPDSLDARLFPSVVLAVALVVTMVEAFPFVVLAVVIAVTMDEASSLSSEFF